MNPHETPRDFDDHRDELAHHARALGLELLKPIEGLLWRLARIEAAARVRFTRIAYHRLARLAMRFNRLTGAAMIRYNRARDHHDNLEALR